MLFDKEGFSKAVHDLFREEYNVEGETFLVYAKDIETIVDLSDNFWDKPPEEEEVNTDEVETEEDVKKRVITVGFGVEEISPVEFVKSCIKEFKVDCPPAALSKSMRLKCNRQFKNVLDWQINVHNTKLLGSLNNNLVGALEVDTADELEKDVIQLSLPTVGFKKYKYKLGTVFGV